MIKRIKHILVWLFGYEQFTKIDLWLKIFRVYGNRLLKAQKKMSLHPVIQQEPKSHLQLKVENSDIFFGYYDHCPISENSSLCLAIKIDSPKVTIFNQNTLVGKKAEIGYFDLSNIDSGFHKIDETSTWCWQQGARLRWFPGENEQIVYNTMYNGKYCAVIQNLNGNVLRYLERPIYDLNKSGSKALSLNFSRLQRMRPGYGYSCLPDNSSLQLCPSDDGVWLCDVDKSESQLLLGLEFLAGFKADLTMEGAEHYINHLSWSLSGQNFLFFHIWCKDGKRHTRVLTCTAEGENLTVLIAGSASHYCWLSDDEVVIVKTENEFLSYYKFDIRSGESESLTSWMPLEDGHPTVISDRYIITDTYPDKFGQQQLLLCDATEKKITQLGSFYASPLGQGEIRCDLHPRYAPGVNSVCFDSSFSGHRTMNILNLSGFSLFQ